MTDLAARIESLDEGLLSTIEPDMPPWDQRALLALHGAVAARAPFRYLEIGSYHGSSLQVVIRDPRCGRIVSIDPRIAEAPDDARGTTSYDDNTTERMVELLREVPGADLAKLTTIESSTDAMTASELPWRPDYCFVDGEHSDEAVLRDARFCAEAVAGKGVIAFHDHQLVAGAIREFLRESWRDISHAVAFTGHVFAVELGGGGILRAPIVDRAIASRWHSAVWRLASRPERSAGPFLAAWSAMPRVDRVIAAAKPLLRRS
jgi:hypothetical protein